MLQQQTQSNECMLANVNLVQQPATIPGLVNNNSNKNAASIISGVTDNTSSSSSKRTIGWQEMHIQVNRPQSNNNKRSKTIGWANLHLCVQQHNQDKFHVNFMNAINMKKYCIDNV